MALTLAEIATRLGGRVAGDPQVLIRQVGPLERAAEGQISFFASPRLRRQLAATRAAAVIVAPDAEALTHKPRIVCDNPYAYFARVSQLLNPVAAFAPGVDPAAHVAPGARVSPSARIEPGAVVEEGAEIGERSWIGAQCHVGAGASIGADSRLYPSVVVYARCRIGARAILHSGAVIGADGFGFAEEGQQWVKIPQIGRVWIGDDVEIGANTTIDRGAMDDTVIEDGVKIDNQVQVGHNCRIGAHTAIAGCAGIAGSCVIGKRCRIAGAAMLLGQLTICDDVQVSVGTVVSHSIRTPGIYTGIFPIDAHADWLRNAAYVRHLADLAQRVRALEQLLQQKEAGHG
jgi:UDP-3-O-[3-hydroxymyristoyl] glucosamine N-acyltransferase